MVHKKVYKKDVMLLYTMCVVCVCVCLCGREGRWDPHDSD